MIYNYVDNSVEVKNRCNWYEFGEKSNKFFLNPEKKCGCQNALQNIILKNREFTDLQQINRNILPFYQDLFSEKFNADKKGMNSPDR